MKKLIVKTIIIALAVLGFALTANTKSPIQVQFELSALCQAHPQDDCAEIMDYCREALESGNECYYVK